MLTKPILQRAVKQVGQRFKSYKPVPIKNTYNDLPQPCGSWETNYKAQQRKYNLYLLTGIGWTMFSILMLKTNIFFNYSPPDCPSGKIDYSKK
ncbi:uncharacterized protein LOC108741900 [Agrilus planipennis]|uniref:Uncharacterized protein LOC108741900 n=1 Tax=Agrilus planipennis TaxID=224129 RepID=A0A1W4XJ33_AGRPL|nr:uncharacterized protein LOC108741900 [Agrilus planipennis]